MEEVFADMKRLDKPINFLTYSTLINAHLRHRSFARAEELFDEMKTNGIEPNDFIYRVLVTSLLDRGEWAKCDALLAHAQAREMKYFPERIVFALLPYWAQRKETHQRALYWLTATPAFLQDKKQSINGFNLFLHMLATHSDMLSCINFTNEIRALKLSLNKDSYSSLFRAATQARLAGAAGVLLAGMKRDKIPKHHLQMEIMRYYIAMRDFNACKMIMNEIRDSNFFISSNYAIRFEFDTEMAAAEKARLNRKETVETDTSNLHSGNQNETNTGQNIVIKDAKT
jgi:pentatricopeptide repeat protein